MGLRFAAYRWSSPAPPWVGPISGRVDASIGSYPELLGSSVAAIAVGGLVMFISGLLVRYRQDARAEHPDEGVG